MSHSRPMFKPSILTLKHIPTVEIYPVDAFMSGRMVIHEHDIVISVLSPGMEHPKMLDNHERTLRLQFIDLSGFRMDTQAREHYGDFLMTPNHARAIINFVEPFLTSGLEMEKAPNRVMIHCEAGISRSPAIGIALTTIYGLLPTPAEMLRQHFAYNEYVLHLMMDAWRSMIVERIGVEMKQIF